MTQSPTFDTLTADAGSFIPSAYGGHNVRTLTVDGEPWFVLADLCKVLGLSNPSRVAQRLDPDTVNTLTLTTGRRGNPNVTIVNEPGMYDVVIRSDKPAAVQFRRWITSKVLPSIRKTGSYSVPGAAPALTDAEIMSRAHEIATRTLAALDRPSPSA